MKPKISFDPRALLGITAASSLSSVLIQRVEFSVISASMIFVFGMIAGADIKGVFIKCKRLWQVVIFASLMQSIFLPSGVVLLAIAEVPILTMGGLEKGVVILLRMASLLCGAAILLTKGQAQLIAGMIGLGVPYEFAYMVMIGLRFLPIMRDELEDGLISIQLRGVDIGHIPWRKKAEVYSYLLFPAVAGAAAKAKDLAVSMELRGFRANKYQTPLMTLKCSAKDYWALGGFTTLTVLLLVCYYMVL